MKIQLIYKLYIEVIKLFILLIENWLLNKGIDTYILK